MNLLIHSNSNIVDYITFNNNPILLRTLKMKLALLIPLLLLISPSYGQVNVKINKENKLDSIVILNEKKNKCYVVFDSIGFINFITDDTNLPYGNMIYYFKDNSLESVKRIKKEHQNFEYYLFNNLGSLIDIRTEKGNKIDTSFYKKNPIKVTFSENNIISKYEFDTNGAISRIYEGDSLLNIIGNEVNFFNSEIQYVNNYNLGVLLIFHSGRMVEIKSLFCVNQDWNIKFNYKKNKLSSIYINDYTSLKAHIFKFNSNGIVKKVLHK